jgi:hypothetical protein
MRGNTRRSPGIADPACAPRGLAGGLRPRAPRPRGALPLVGSPAQRRFAPCTPDRRVCPLGTRTQGALLPETPVPAAGNIPLRPHPLLGCQQ